ncbi:proline-rich domain-containing protein [Longimycelium tulufanense]|nr:proline-rich domain-containing protein [Longimycelium tulufanense]
MTEPTCRDRGGNWSLYVTYVMRDTPALLEFFQPELGGPNTALKAAILQGYRELPSRLTVPAGYCVDDVKQWAGADAQGKPFGFPWGNDSEHRTSYTCNDSGVGAERAPCNGFYLSCAGASDGPSKARCQVWNDFSDEYVRQVNELRRKAIQENPSSGQADTRTRVKSPSEIALDLATWVTKHGMEQVVAFVVENVTKLWSTFLEIVVKYSSANIEGKGFAKVYNLVAGVALALAFLGWIVSVASSWKAGRLQYTLVGGLKAVVGVTLAGVGAILMMSLADECTRQLAAVAGDLASQADWTTSLAKANPLVAVIVGALMALFLIFAIVFLIAIGPLVLVWALFGSFAAAGQVHAASAHWLARWAGRLTALCWAKFFMVATLMLSVALLMPLDAGESAMRQIVDVVQGLVLGVMFVLSPWLLWELVDFVSDRIGGGGASGGPASTAAAARTSGAASAAGAALGGVGSAVAGAVGTMMSNAADVARRGFGRDDGDSGGGSGTPTPTQPENQTGGSFGTTGNSPTKPSSAQGGTPSGANQPPAGPPGQSSGSGTAAGAPRPPANRGRVVASSPNPPTPKRGGGAPSGSGPTSGTSGGPAGGGGSPPTIPPPP